VEACGIGPGQRVLDVATGTGNVAIRAAEAGADVVASDLEPAQLAAGRDAAPEIDWVEADAAALPFADGEFDVVTSSAGVIFAPDHQAAADELVRVCRPGGTIGLANWTPAGFIGQLLKTVTKHVPPPAGVRPPSQWGTEERLRELLGDGVSRLEITRRTYVWRFRSPEEFAGFFKELYGPTRKAFEALDEDGQRRLWDDLVALARDHDTERGLTVAMPAEYLEVIATRA
jgi:SAM-dependent methyltransferase